MIFWISANISCIIVAGGNEGPSVEVLTDNRRTKELPNLPKHVKGNQDTFSKNAKVDYSRSSLVLHDGTILLCGGRNNMKNCLQLDHSTWKTHSVFNVARVGHSSVTTRNGTFLFGGTFSRKSFEYLPKGSNTWLLGMTLIPGYGFNDGCAIAFKSEEEILLIGGFKTEKRILSFNVKDHTFRELPFRLNEGRIGHRCAFIPNTTKVMITGGFDLGSTEILDIEDESIVMASGLNFKRRNHGMGILTINGEDRLATFGGENRKAYMCLDNVEIYNPQTEEWETTDMKLERRRSDFGFLTVKLDSVLPGLQYCSAQNADIFGHS